MKKRTVFDVVQVVFGNCSDWKEGQFKNRVIATCKTRALAQGVVARNNTALHRFEIVEREAMK